MEKNYGIGFIITLIIIGVFSIFIYCIRAIWWDNSNGISDVITLFGIALLIAGSAMTIGSLAGFIFAIPKTVTDNNLDFNSTKKYIGNDNLVQISDWLTKIIVGVGLTNLSKIPLYIQSLGKYLGDALGGTTNGEVASVSIVLYFLICGFLISYLWTRLTFGKMLNSSEQINSNLPQTN